MIFFNISVNPENVEMNELMFPKLEKEFEVKCTVSKYTLHDFPIETILTLNVTFSYFVYCCYNLRHTSKFQDFRKLIR